MIDFATLDRIKKLYGFPKFFKEAELDYSPNELKPQEWADPTNKLYPCHSPSATYISNAQFWDEEAFSKQASTDVADRLLEMAKFWGIDDELKSHVYEKVAAVQLAESLSDFGDDAFALVTEDPATGDTIRAYPITTPELVKTSGTLFTQERHRMPLSWRKQAAQALYKSACSFNIDFDTDEIADAIERSAGKGVSHKSTIAREMRKRAAQLQHNKRTPEAEALKEAAARVEASDTTHELAEKSAALLDTVDRKTGLYRKYGQSIGLPEDVCHSTLMKHAMEAVDDYVQLETGSTYEIADLEKLGFALYRRLPQYKKQVTNPLGGFDKEASVEVLKKMPVEDAIEVEYTLDDHKVDSINLPFNLRSLY